MASNKNFDWANKQSAGDERLIQTGNYFEPGNTSLEKVWRSKGVADPRIANAANYWGVNYLKTGAAIAKPAIGYGYIFFTRPRLRLTYDNLIKNRTFAMMLNNDPNSMQAIARAYLDPVGHRAGTFECPRVDPRNPFISILTNNCINASGFPDVPVQVYSTKAGLMGEQVSLADGFPTNLSDTTITASFKNVKNDFINYLFYMWTQYSMLSHRGVMMPYKDDWLYNRINYNTRIYRLVTDPTGTYIIDMAMTGASIPINSNKSSAYDYEGMGQDGEVYNKNLNEASIQFHSNGTYIHDPIILKQFNRTMEMFCPELAPKSRDKHFVKLSMAMKPYFSNTALPYIDLRNAKLEWFVDKTFYSSELKLLGDM